MSTRLLAIACATLALGAAAPAAQRKARKRPRGAPQGHLEWQRLFNGSDLGGWTVEGKGVWVVDDGCIVGKQDPHDRRETWLLSDAEFDDFVLVAKVRITPNGNSGVFFRAPKVRGHPGRKGFEMQVWDADTRFPTGSIYDLAKAPPKLQRAGWNRVMICCIGHQLFTAVNGRVAALVEPKRARSLSGRVGFQVHGGVRYADTVVQVKDVYAAPVARPAQAPGGVRFKKVKLDGGINEAAAVFDVDGDGRKDIVCGPYWYRNPTWKAYPVRQVAATADEAESFYELPCDVNGDGRIDLIAGGGRAKAEYWFENPGRPGRAWLPHEYLTRKAPIHDMMLCDLNGDGRRRELLPNGNGSVQWIAIGRGRNPQFAVHSVGTKGRGYGIGCGDLNKDGRGDIITPQGWYQAPPRPTRSRWKWRPEFKLKGKPGVPIHAIDLNGDGHLDLVYGHGHGHGLWWLEQRPESDEKSTWTEHAIDDDLAQAHSIAFGDINGDGRLDLVTGKRWQAGNGSDPGDHEPSWLVWLEHDGAGQGWKRRTIDFATGPGCGMGLQLADIDGDGDLDIVAPGKGGLYLFLNEGPIR